MGCVREEEGVNHQALGAFVSHLTLHLDQHSPVGEVRGMGRGPGGGGGGTDSLSLGTPTKRGSQDKAKVVTQSNRYTLQQQGHQ